MATAFGAGTISTGVFDPLLGQFVRLADDFFCVDLVNPLESNREVKQVAALLPLIKSA
jgi:hypothetical protein